MKLSMETSEGNVSESAATQPQKELHLPVSRVKTIMKSSPEVEAVGPAPLFLVTKLTELFVINLAQRAFDLSKNRNVEYKHLASVVKHDDTLDFLREIMPCKITVAEYKQIMAKRAARGDDESSSEEESAESSLEEEDDQETKEEEVDDDVIEIIEDSGDAANGTNGNF